MDRRNFLLTASAATISNFALHIPAKAFATNRFIVLSDPEEIIPSAVAFQVENCRYLANIGNVLKQKSLLDLRSDQQFTDMNAFRALAAQEIATEIATLEAEIQKLKSGGADIDQEQYKIILDTFVGAVSTIATIALAVTTTKIRLIATVATTAYSLGNFVVQMSYRDLGGLDVLSFINSRNNTIGLIPHYSKYKIHSSFSYYSAITETLSYGIALGVYYKKYSRLGVGKRRLENTIRNAEVSVSRLKGVLFNITGSETEFVELLRFCKSAVINSIDESIYLNSQCWIGGGANVSNFFEHFSPEQVNNFGLGSSNVLP